MDEPWISDLGRGGWIGSGVRSVRETSPDVPTGEPRLCYIQATEPKNAPPGSIWYDTSSNGTTVAGVRVVTTITGDLNPTTNAHDVILCDTTLTAITVTLQDPASRGNKQFDIVNIGRTGKAVTVLPNGSETIQHGSSLVIGNNSGATIVNDFVNWWKI